MHKSSSGIYYYSDNFGAIECGFENAGSMLIILPDERVTPETLLGDPDAKKLMYSHGRDVNYEHVLINLSLPKFDVSGMSSMADGMIALGVTDIFSPSTADLSALVSNNVPAYVDKISQAVRVKIDEEGCEAAAYTAIYASGSAVPPTDVVNFVVNRPFIFVVKGMDGMPLFMGIIGNP